MARFTDAKVRSLKVGVHADGDGLYLQVRDGGRRSWVFRYTRAKRAHWLGLGSYPDVGLSEARDAAGEARKTLRAGIDPLEQRRAARAEAAARAGLNTFEEVAGAYIKSHAAGWSNAKHADQWRTSLKTYAYPLIGKLSVAVVDTGHVTRILDPIWSTKAETATRVRGRIESVLDYAKARGWRTGENPARWKGHLENALPARAKVSKVEHHAALPWAEIGTFMSDLSGQEGVAALALRFIILTAARSGEATGARWAEIDMQAAVWTVPAARMKAGHEHRVPLSDAALSVLREAAKLRQGDGLAFPGATATKALSNNVMPRLLRRMNRGGQTTHGFRSTFRDWCAETTAYPREVCEAALAHAVGDRVEAAYRRGDLFEKRRKLMDAWADYCSRPASAGGEVIPLRSAG